MSNPGVIYLTNTVLSSGKNFRVEDNIGEAIHIHYDEIRIDLEVFEFLNLAEVFKKTFNEFIDVENFNIEDYDLLFLSDISKYLSDLIEIEYTKINLKDVLVKTKNIFGLPVVKKLKYSRVVKALNGREKELKSYHQENYIGIDNFERLNSLRSSLENSNYQLNNKIPVFFNNQNHIRDGQHRAGIIYKNKGNIEIPIIRLKFKNNRYNATRYPLVKVLFYWNLKKIKRVLMIFIRFSKRILKLILLKIAKIIKKQV